MEWTVIDMDVAAMLKDLIVNGSLIISLLFLAGQIFRSSSGLDSVSSLKLKLMIGSVTGLLGSALMLFSIHVTDHVIMDMRHIALILATIYGGWIASAITVILLSVTRIVLFGFSDASLTAVVVLVVLSVGCVFMTRFANWSFAKKYWAMVLYSLVLSFAAITFLIGDAVVLANILVYYSLLLLSTAFFSYHVATYIENSNVLFRKYLEESKLDFLTGLNNVRQFDELFNSQLKTVEERKELLSVLMIDIDHFKKVNDTYGHAAGDLVLQRLGVILKNTTRIFDIVSRNGGEEFSALLLDCPHQRALEIAERMRSTVQNTPFRISGTKSIDITISIGVATFPDTVPDIHQLLQQADIALYTAKRSGRNCVYSA